MQLRAFLGIYLIQKTEQNIFPMQISHNSEITADFFLSSEYITLLQIKVDYLKKIWQKVCRQNIKAVGGAFQMLHNFLQDYMVDQKSKCELSLTLGLNHCVPQECTAACSSATASARRMSSWPWTTVKNPCRRSTSPPFCRPFVDTSECSGKMAKLADGNGNQNLQGTLPPLLQERLRRTEQMTGLPWPPRPGETMYLK